MDDFVQNTTLLQQEHCTEVMSSRDDEASTQVDTDMSPDRQSLTGSDCAPMSQSMSYHMHQLQANNQSTQINININSSANLYVLPTGPLVKVETNLLLLYSSINNMHML